MSGLLACQLFLAISEVSFRTVILSPQWFLSQPFPLLFPVLTVDRVAESFCSTGGLRRRWAAASSERLPVAPCLGGQQPCLYRTALRGDWALDLHERIDDEV